MVFTCHVSACEVQPFSCHDLANDIYSQTAKTVFSHFNVNYVKSILVMDVTSRRLSFSVSKTTSNNINRVQLYCCSLHNGL